MVRAADGGWEYRRGAGLLGGRVEGVSHSDRETVAKWLSPRDHGLGRNPLLGGAPCNTVHVDGPPLMVGSFRLCDGVKAVRLPWEPHLES